jgi:succinate dehydrogenase / fumarate reductase cytochrome b subunit
VSKVETAGPAPAQSGSATPARTPRKVPFVVEAWRSAIVKKWVMAITGIMMLGFVLAHMIGNLKVFLGKDDINEYAEWLRHLGHPALPNEVILWILRVSLIAAVGLHILAAVQLTRMNRKARPVGYQSPRDYAAANYAGRTMRWSGVIVALFVIFHLLDLTWGPANPDFVSGNVYHNMFESFRRVPVAIVYIVAQVALTLHIWHGAWSMFQSLGVNNPRYNAARRHFATAFAGLILIGNVSMPLLITTRVVKP